MTAQTTPNYTMNYQANGAILLDVERKLRQMKAAEKKTESSYLGWQQLVAQQAAPAPMLTSDNDAAPLVGALLTGLLDMLFGGMPVMQTLAEGLGGTLALTDNPAPRVAPLHNVAKINTALKNGQTARYTAAKTAQSGQTRQMQMLQQMTMMLMLNMLTQSQDDTASGTGDDGGLVPDVLRDPKMARFKQNRHSISCIRTMFQDQIAMTAPRYSVPRLHFN